MRGEELCLVWSRDVTSIHVEEFLWLLRIKNVQLMYIFCLLFDADLAQIVLEVRCKKPRATERGSEKRVSSIWP